MKLERKCRKCLRAGFCTKIRYYQCRLDADTNVNEQACMRRPSCENRDLCGAWWYWEHSKKNVSTLCLLTEATMPEDGSLPNICPGCEKFRVCRKIREYGCSLLDEEYDTDVCIDCDISATCALGKYLIGGYLAGRPFIPLGVRRPKYVPGCTQGEDMNKDTEDIINMKTREGKYMETAVVPFGPENPLATHLEVIAQRKDISERQMIALAQELWVVALYVRQNLISIQNCRFVVDMSAADNLNITFRLLQEEEKRCFLRRIKSTRVASLMTWKELVPEELDVRVGNSTLKRADTKLTTASFSVTKAWKTVDVNFPHSFVKLLPTARMLVGEQLEYLKSEAEGDIAFVDGTEEV